MPSCGPLSRILSAAASRPLPTFPVAVSAALAVVEPSSSGLGGGGFYLLHRQADAFETMVDAREKAPGAASRDMYLDKAGNAIDNASIAGSQAAAIPGGPAAFEYLARKYGKLSLKQDLQPAIAPDVVEGAPHRPRPHCQPVVERAGQAQQGV